MKRRDYSDLATIGLAILLGVALLVLSLVAQPAKAASVSLTGMVLPAWSFEMFRASTLTAMNSDTWVDVHINSKGGYVSAAYATQLEMDLGRSRGLKYRCFVDGVAASAAFMILAACDKRIAYPGSRFMWHRMVLAGEDPPTEEEQMKLDAEQESVNAMLAASMGIDFKDFYPYYDKEIALSTKEIMKLAPGFVQLGGR